MFELLRRHRRQRILRQHAFSDDLWKTVTSELPVLYGLDANELSRLRELATVFAWEKKFFGVHGLEVTDYMRATVAAQACLPILNLGIDLYRGWHTVILYPETFIARHEYHDDAGIVHEGVGELDGESVEGGPVVLSWAEAAPRPPEEHDGTNVVVHEFAHKLDYLTGTTNGLPPLHRDMKVNEWASAFSEAFAAFTEMVDVDDELPFDDYAAEDPGEFFAVMSEYFFEDPERLNDVFPAVYDQLRKYYRQDPLARLGAA
jgi:Mlc titration factor MtfA (ptsG expression regulator)